MRPQAESALRRAAARGIERDVRMQQERHVVARHVHVALVDLRRPRHGIQVFDLRAVGVVQHLAVLLVADAENLAERFAVGVLHDGIIEFATADEVQRRTLVQCAVGIGGHRRSDERDADRRIRRLDGLGKPLVALPSHRGSEEHKELVALADLDGLLGGDVVGRCVEHPRTLKQAGRIGEPDRVPVGLDLACRRPTRAGAAVEVLKGGRVEEDCFQWHGHQLNSTIRDDSLDVFVARYGDYLRSEGAAYCEVVTLTESIVLFARFALVAP